MKYFCSGRIDNPKYDEEMIEYNRRKKEMEEEDEEHEGESENDSEVEDDFNEENDYLRKPSKKIDCPICHGLGTKYQTTTT